MSDKPKAKLNITNIPGLEKVDKSAAQQKWKTIEKAIDQIYQQNASQLSFQSLYTASYQIVLHKHGDILYDGVQQTLSNYIKDFRDVLLNKPEETFLNDLLAHWEKHRTAVTMIRDILMYLERNYVPQNKKTGIFELGTQIFASDKLFRQPHILHRFQTLILGLIRKERDGDANVGQNSRFLMKNLSSMLLELNKKEIYEKCFEQPFLQDSEQYFKKEAALFFHSSTVRDYLSKVQVRLREERERAERCFEAETRIKVENVVKTEMLEKYKTALTDKEGSGVSSMLDSWKLEDLRLVFEVLGIVQGALQPTIDKVRGFCTDNGIKIVNDAEKNKKPLELIEEVLNMRDKYEDMLIKSFSTVKDGVTVKDKDFDTAIRRAFEDICNSNSRFPEYLSAYADSKLTKGKTEVLEQEYDFVFDRIINVFRHVRQKDVFEKYFKLHLSKRLLNGRSASDEAERVFITKLKADLGFQFTAKLEGMFLDMKLTKDYNDAFKEHLRKREVKHDVDLHATVLTTNSWPINPNSQCNLPNFLNKACDAFKDFYLDRHSGRRLTWQYNMGNADIKLNGFDANYQVNVSTYQMAVLLLFNQNNQLSFRDIQVATNIPSADLKMNLFALCTDTKSSKRLLIKNTADKTISDDALFSFNHGFNSSKVKFKIAPVVIIQTQEEASATSNEINEDRKWQIDAVIVRIMKSRKTLDHRDLVIEVTKQLQSRFTPSPDIIKRCIESLIEREFLERHETIRGRYNYLA